MANRKQQRAYAARRHIQTEINRRLFRASRVAQIMHINMLHERSHALSNIYSASVFSYLADDSARAATTLPVAKQTPLIPVPGLSCTLRREAFAHL